MPNKAAFEEKDLVEQLAVPRESKAQEVYLRRIADQPHPDVYVLFDDEKDGIIRRVTVKLKKPTAISYWQTIEAATLDLIEAARNQ